MTYLVISQTPHGTRTIAARDWRDALHVAAQAKQYGHAVEILQQKGRS